jgi:hypothetical protein
LQSSDYASLIRFYKIGVNVDLFVALSFEITGYYFNLKRRRHYFTQVENLPVNDIKFSILFKRNWGIEQNSRWGLFTLILILTGVLTVFPIRNGQSYPEFLMTTPFNVFQFIIGAVSMLFILSMYKLFEYGRFWCRYKTLESNMAVPIKDFISQNAISAILGRIVTWFNFPIYILIMINIASLQMILSDLYNQYSSLPLIDILLPYNMSVPIESESFIMKMTFNASLGLDQSYASQAKKFIFDNIDDASLGSSRLFNGGLNSTCAFFLSSGLILCFSSLLDFLMLGECDWNSLRNLCRLGWKQFGILNRLFRFTFGILIAFMAAISWKVFSSIFCLAIVGFIYTLFSIIVVIENILRL